MPIFELKPGIVCVGCIDWDRRLFDELIPLPDGTSYNSYVVKGADKVALMDTVDPTKTVEFLANLHKAGVKKIDYVIAHHGEQDHSGSIPAVLAAYPGAKVVTNQKCKALMMDLLKVPESDFMVINDGDKLSLGGKTMEFIFTPWVHWPETFSTYVVEDAVLFTCDFFGSHLATSEMVSTGTPGIYRAAKRYYAEILMPFRAIVRKNVERVSALKLDMIAPSHGPIHSKPEFVINAYKEWTSDEVKNEAVVAWVSMHGSTQRMAEHLVDALMARGVRVRSFNLTRTDIGELAMALVDAATLVVGTPTVLAGPHPAAVYAAVLANAIRPKVRYASVFGSYGWGGKAVETIAGLIPNLKVEIIPPVLVKGDPSEEDMRAVDNLAAEISRKHKENKLL